jgi:ribosomal protein S18 acetylase RimI-like enzyme
LSAAAAWLLPQGTFRATSQQVPHRADLHLNIRPAARADCRDIAMLYRIASDGVADYIWTKLAKPGEDVLDVGRRRYEREDSVFSYRNATLVEADRRTIGMLVAFPMLVDPDYVEKDPVLVPYSKLEEPDSYYLCAMSMLPEYRGRGIGSGLLPVALDKARQCGLQKLSLIVFEQNTGAKRLYDRLGFVAKARAPVVPHPLIRYTGDAILMTRGVD